MIDLVWKVKKEKLRGPNNSQVSDFVIKMIGYLYFTEHLLSATTILDIGDSLVKQISEVSIFIEILLIFNSG